MLANNQRRMWIDIQTMNLLPWMIIAAFVVETSAQQTFTTTSYKIRSLANDTYLTSAVRIFEKTRTTIKCGVKCSQLTLVSFFFVKQSSTCYCNDNVDSAILSSKNEGHIKYGFIPVSALPEPPPASNCSTPLFSTCNSTGTSSNWIVFQRRMDGSVDFHRNWIDYVNGFGTADGEYWLGLEKLHQHTTAGCRLYVYLEAGPNNISAVESGHAMYSYFSVGSSDTNYTLIIDGFSSTAGIGDSLMYHNGSEFSTRDNDNDASDSNCAIGCAGGGGFWFRSCYDVNLNGLYLGGEHADFGRSIEWFDPWTGYFSLWKTEMSFTCN